MSWDEILKSLVFWGPGAVIAGVMIFAIYKFATNIGLKFIDAQRDQALALGRQAQSMEGLTNSIQESMNRDNNEHKEILILLKVIVGRLENMETEYGCQERTV